jgi:hypothetical protein
VAVLVKNACSYAYSGIQDAPNVPRFGRFKLQAVSSMTEMLSRLSFCLEAEQYVDHGLGTEIPRKTFDP